jgi:hypothetical protein
LRLPVDTGKLGPITWLEQQAQRLVLRRQALLHQLEQQRVLLEQLQHQQQVLLEQLRGLELQELQLLLFCRKQTKQQQR